MRRLLCQRVPALLLPVVLVACASHPGVVTPVLAPPDQQYRCAATLHVSDATAGYVLKGNVDGDPVSLRLGEPLAAQVKAIWWQDALVPARQRTAVNLGFGTGSSVRAARQGRGVEVRVNLQYQLFRPTGQSYSDLAIGTATAATLDEASALALQKAVRQLERVLHHAGICHRADAR